MGRALLSLLFLSLLSIMSEGSVYADADDLDLSFGPNETGIVTIDLGPETDDQSFIADAELQSDGKIVVAGYYRHDGNSDLILVRFNSDGTLDATFGEEGTVITDLGAPDDKANAVSMTSGGKIVVVGRTGDNFAVLRYNADGSLDSTFNGDGIVTTDFGGVDEANDVVATFDGRILVVGSSTIPSFWGRGSSDFALAKYRSSGALDPMFDGGGATPGNGKFKTDFGSSDKAYALTYVGARLVVAGQSANNFALAKYNATTGALDTTFDGDGKLTTDFGGSDVAYAIKTVGTTSLIVAGKKGSDFAVAKYLSSNGALDATFSGDGKLTTDIGSSSVDYAYDLAVDRSTNTILVVGTTAGNFGIVRYSFNGDLDPTFGLEGRLTVDLGGDYDEASCLVLDRSNDKFILGGKKGIGTADGEIALVRLGVYSADVGIRVEASSDPVPVATDLIYTITLHNEGSDLVRVYGLDGDFDRRFSFVSVSSSQGECAFYEGDNELNCSPGLMSGGETITVTLILRPTEAGSYGGVVLLHAVPDNNSANNRVDISSVVTSPSP